MVPLDSEDAPGYDATKRLDGTVILDAKARFGQYAGGDGANYSLNIGDLDDVLGSLSWNVVEFDNLKVRGRNKEEAVDTAKRLIDELPIGNKEKYFAALDKFIEQRELEFSE